MSIPLAELEDLVDGSGIAPEIEVLLPAGVRHRQLAVRTLILGMLLALDDGRPAQLTRVHAALTALPAGDQARLGVSEDWKQGPHQLTYRQVEHTFHLVLAAIQGGRQRAGCVFAGERGFRGGSGCGGVGCDDTVSVSVMGRPSPLSFCRSPRGGP